QTRAGYIATFLADVEFFNFFYTLWIIKKLGSPAGMRLPKNFLLYFIPNCWYLPTKLLKLFSNKPYYNGSFYNIDETIQSKDFPEFDARMTRFQKSIIRGRVELFQEMCSKRRSIADRFNAITPHFFPETKNRRFVYTNYVFWTNAKNEVLSAAKDANVLFDKTWPDEGRYRKAQNTSNIEKIKNKMLLLSISPYWSEKDIHVIEQFIHKNSGLFSKPLDF
ncbi:MAG: hypothetical protein JW994_02645, partial [Candidatus Omnitrophica bacterium]|nr:hypothetical protein [Candidatus Omnitrophota bacterium]